MRIDSQTRLFLRHHPLAPTAPSHLYRRPRAPCLSSRSNGPQQITPVRHQYTLPPASHFAPKSSTYTRIPQSPDGQIAAPRNPLNYIDSERFRIEKNQYHKKRMFRAGVGLATCLGLQVYLIITFGDEPPPQTNASAATDQGQGKQRLDAPKRAAELEGKEIVIIGEKPGQPEVKLDQDGNELLETGTSYIPHIPRTIMVPSTSPEPSSTTSALPAPSRVTQQADEQYTLIGHGIRTVSFLSIQVYVMGLYIRTSDLPVLQEALVRQVNPTATSLIPSEKAELRKKLLDGEHSTEIWDKVLKDNKIRSIVRVAPTRNTDFSHMRDGWVRAITTKSREVVQAADAVQGDAAGSNKTEFDDSTFQGSITNFKAFFSGRGKLPRGSLMLLARNDDGSLRILFHDLPKGSAGPAKKGEILGTTADERISRLVWLGYLGGKNVSSEPARENIVKGVMELVERPVGAIGTVG